MADDIGAAKYLNSQPSNKLTNGGFDTMRAYLGLAKDGEVPIKVAVIDKEELMEAMPNTGLFLGSWANAS